MAAGNMAAEQQQAEPEAKGSRKKLIFIILGALLLVGGSIGGTLMIVGGGNETAESGAEEEVTASRDDPSYIDLKPAFTVNLAPEDPVGFLQISMQVLTFNDDVAAELEKHKPLIRNNLLVLFGQQKSAELRAPEGKERLQKSALETVQKVINEQGSGGEVDNVFFTSFVMQ
ncbi:MAG: flagellar basal body-associated FliL family protein [Gammaproteobacteria bacterium]|nr:flagellar basal body-associated FliL family protein [Gammaproteobacteria bacterium]MDH3449857.1 flagellar basal body-associated FliL family protein [Gammaproteobacteria bacterium]